MNNTMEIRAPGMAGKSGTYDQQGIWLDVPWDDIGRGIDGSKFELDPHNFPNLTSSDAPTQAAGTAVSSLLPGAYYYDTGNTIRKAADEPFGAVSLVSDATANDEQWVQPGGNSGGMIVLNAPSAATLPNVAFDACFKLSSIADDVRAMFIGVGEEGMALADTKVDTTGVMVNKDFFGFGTINANGTPGLNAKLAVIYKALGQTQQTVIATLGTLVANTIYRVGFTHLPGVNPETRRISIWFQNVRQLVGVTNAQMAAAAFPSGEEMSPLFGGKGTGANTLKVHRCKVAMWANP
jgi:hypothetical protein